MIGSPTPRTFADEDEEAVAWVTRYQEFQQTACFLGPYRAERALQAALLRDMVGNLFRLGGGGADQGAAADGGSVTKRA